MTAYYTTERVQYGPRQHQQVCSCGDRSPVTRYPGVCASWAATHLEQVHGQIIVPLFAIGGGA